MKHMKYLIGIILFGSLWGFSESIIGPFFSDYGLPSGLIMTGFFALTLMVLSRRLYPIYGMQAGMGLVAGSLRMFNPLGGCHLCSALAIVAEGLLFELLWYSTTKYDFRKLNSITQKISLGIVTGYGVYVGGYIITQILTPLSFGQFYLNNLLSMVPQYLARGLPAALIGGFMIPVILVSLQHAPLRQHLNNTWYYPTSIGVSVLCWIIVLGNFFFI